ncbi:hypothetical protein FE257_002863 [Aspergillus nanangensis]|uniref:Amine oxidase n=1 Tax=Aspergillus nanangensis TaxID=2582783 RepID=A0AAD4CSI1_ASPNN|nr:hypothetical protein FE257_002863 [Aspergillus nanangensis]
MSDSTATNKLYDVIIIGAGLSGLQAASSLRAAGRDICVLEATDRVGGKTLSVQSTEDGFNDLGAAWINDTSQSEMYQLFERYGIHGEVQYTQGDNVYNSTSSPGGAIRVPYGMIPEGEETISKVISACIAATDKVRLDDPGYSEEAWKLDQITFTEFCTRDMSSKDEALVAEAFATAVTDALLGVAADELSALCMMHYFKCGTGILNLLSDLKDGGQHLRAREGMQTISKRMAGELGSDTIHLQTPVTSVDQSASRGHCTVKTAIGEVFTSRHVVLSIPTTLYHTIKFTPSLPSAKASLGHSTIMGDYSKMIFLFSEPWWRHAGLTGTLDDDDPSRPISFSRDTSIPDDNQWSITCFIVGNRARRWSELSKEERQDQAWKQFTETFGSIVETVPLPTNTLEMIWKTQPFFWGAPCPVMPLEVLTTVGGELEAPFGNVHFVGAETSDVWRGYMEGAVRSGKRGAEEVLEALR